VGMDYPVTCACGRTHRVSSGAAGTRLVCGCGRQVEVPSLHALRTQAGELTVSVELLLGALLRDGHFPEEKDCLRCGIPTTDICYALVVCERPEVRSKYDWSLSLVGLLFGHLVFSRRGEDRERGRNVSFRLPLRVCSDCTSRLRHPALVEAMRQVPLYGQLLEKYPQAEVSLERK
jgi:hypothetical protein